MFIDYIGQELIWELRCNHPYQKNWRSTEINIRISSYEQNRETTAFLFKHLKANEIEKVIYENEDKGIVKEFQVKTVFGEVSRLIYYNKFL